MKLFGLVLTSMILSFNADALTENTIKRIEEACVCKLDTPEFNSGLNPTQVTGGAISFVKKPEFKDCIAESIFLAEEIYSDPTNSDNEKKKFKDYEKSLKKSAKSKTSPICERQEVKDWYKKMKYGLKNKPDVFKALVDQTFCDAEYCVIDNKGKKNKITINIGMPEVEKNVQLCNVEKKTSAANVKTCREALGKLAIQNRDSIARNCEVDLKKLSSKNALTNKCVELNTYKTVYLSKYELFEKQYCIAEGIVTEKGDYSSLLDQERDCRLLIQPIQSKIFSIAISKDEKYKECADSTVYITDQAKFACRSLLIGKILGFHSDKEKLGLYACIMNRDESKMNLSLNRHYSNDGKEKKYVKKFDGKSTEECFDKYLGAGDPEEEKKLKEIADKFCAQETTETGKKECLKQVLALYGESLNIDKCNAIEDEDEKQKCIRELLYAEILAAEGDSYAKCWDVSSYPESADREKCLESVKSFNKILDECYPDKKATFTIDVQYCISGKLDGTNYEHLDRFDDLINSKAAKVNPDRYAMCKQNKLNWICLGYVADNNESKDKPYEGANAAGYCVEQSPGFDQCLDDYWKKTYSDLGMSFPSGGPLKSGTTNLAGTNVNGLPGSNLNGADQIANVPINGTKVGKTGAVIGGTTLVTGAGALVGTSGGGNIDPMSLTTNSDEVRKKQFFGILRDFKYIGIRGKEAPCSSLRKAAWVRVGSLVAGLGAMTFAGVKAAKHIKKGKEEDRGQQASWEATGMILGATAGALGLRALGNLWAKSIVEKARTQELTRLSTPGPPPPREIKCQKGAGSKKTTFLDFNLFKNISKSAVASIKKAQSYEEVNNLFNEWESFAFGETVYISQISENELNALFEPDESSIPLEMLKKTLVASVEGMAGLIIPEALANENSNEGGMDIMSMLPQIISIASAAGIFDGKDDGGSGNGTNVEPGARNGTVTKSRATNTTIVKKSTTTTKDNSRSVAKKIDKKIDGDLGKYQAIDLLNDYGATLGSDMPDFEKSKMAADKNVSDFNVLKDAHSIDSNDAKVEKVEFDRTE